jgi:hypothetical protein
VLAQTTHAASASIGLRLRDVGAERKLIAGVPDAATPIAVPCNSSDICNHGGCRKSVCLCDSGWYTADATSACAAEAKSQLSMALLQYFLGYFGVAPFMLGWTAWGVTTIVLLVLLCCLSFRQEQEGEDACGFLLLCRCGLGCELFVVWIVLAVAISTNCVDKHGVKCKSW